MRGERLIYSEKYRKPGLRVMPVYLPKFYHTNGMKPMEVLITQAGKVSRGRKVHEFQDIRVYFEEAL